MGLLGQLAAEHPVQLVGVDRPDRPAQGRLVRGDVAAGHRMASGAQPGASASWDSSPANSPTATKLLAPDSAAAAAIASRDTSR